MNRLYSSLAILVNKDKSKKAGDASDKSYQVTTTDIPAYIYGNRICYEGISQPEPTQDLLGDSQ